MVVYPGMFTRRPNLLFGLVFLLILPGLFWGLPSAISPQDDAPLPLGALLFVAEYTKSHLNTTYPAFHQLLLLPVYALAFAVYWLTGGISHLSSIWPYGMRNVSGFFSVLISLTNLVSAIMAVFLLRTAVPYVERRRRWLWFADTHDRYQWSVCLLCARGESGHAVQLLVGADVGRFMVLLDSRNPGEVLPHFGGHHRCVRGRIKGPSRRPDHRCRIPLTSDRSCDGGIFR